MKIFGQSLFLASTASALTVTPPLPPVQSATVLDVASPTFLNQQSSNSRLPSQQALLDATSSSFLLSAETKTAAASSAPPAKQNLAGSGVAITGINYDGKVATTEADEYVIVKNANKQPIDVSGYYIYVATTGTQGPTFYFPKGSIIKPNQSVRVYTNEIHPETGGYSYKSGKALWNNRGGLAVMKEDNGKKVCEFKYKPAA